MHGRRLWAKNIQKWISPSEPPTWMTARTSRGWSWWGWRAGTARHVGSPGRATAGLCGRLCWSPPRVPCGDRNANGVTFQGHIWGSNKNVGFMLVHCKESILILNFDLNIATYRRTAGCASMSARVFQISWWHCWVSELHSRTISSFSRPGLFIGGKQTQLSV